MTYEGSALTYETLRDQLAAAGPASSPEARTLIWAENSRSVAVSRDPGGRLEVFVVGVPVDATDRLVSENLEHHVWTTASGEVLPASRLVLPEAEHFDGVAAFICTELTQNGIAVDRDAAFRRSEPVIALAMRRAALSNQALVGLAGEVFVLARLVESLPHRAASIVDGWFGSGPSSRDLQLGPIGVEIKTTTSSESVHHIQGLHQVEKGVSVDDVPETHLFLLSVGVEWLPVAARSGRTVPGLVEAVASALPDTAHRDAFLDRVKQYGGDSALGYDHRANRASQRYLRPFQTRFERLYDLSDQRIKLLGASDVADASNVDQNSVSYRVRLPAKVRGDVNPVAGMRAISAQLDHLMRTT
jgi:hypothetical protein